MKFKRKEIVKDQMDVLSTYNPDIKVENLPSLLKDLLEEFNSNNNNA